MKLHRPKDIFYTLSSITVEKTATTIRTRITPIEKKKKEFIQLAMRTNTVCKQLTYSEINKANCAPCSSKITTQNN